MTSPEPISVSATVLAQMFLYIESLQVDIDAFLRSLDIEPETVRSPLIATTRPKPDGDIRPGVQGRANALRQGA